MASTAKDVFVIQKRGDKSYWHRAGAAFVNRDGSINVRLDLFPEADIQIRDRKPREDKPQPAAGSRRSRRQPDDSGPY